MNHALCAHSSRRCGIETRLASEAESERLKIEPWSPVLVVTRVAQMDDGRPFEVAVAVSRGDRYEYRVKLHSRNQIVVPG